MKKRINVAFYFVPVFYLAIIGILLFLQFKPVAVKPAVDSTGQEIVATTEKVESVNVKKAKFSKKIGNITVSSRKKVKQTKTNATTDSALVSIDGLVFEFENKNDIQWINAAGKASQIELEEVQFDKKQVVLLFEKDIKIVFENQDNGNIAVSANSTNRGTIKVSLAIASGSTLFNESQSSTIISIGKKNSTVLLQSANKENEIQLNLTISPTENIASAQIVMVSNADIWSGITDAFVAKSFETEFETARRQFSQGFRSARYNSDSKLWDMGGQFSNPTPELISAIVVEGASLESPQSVFNFLQDAGIYSYDRVAGGKYQVNIRSEVQNLKTALIFGNLKQNWDRYAQEARTQLSRFRTAASSSNFAALNNPELIHQIALFGNNSDAPAFEKLATAAYAKANTLNLAQAVLLGTQYTKLFTATSAFNTALASGSDKLAKSMSLRDGAAWVAVDGQANVEATFLAAIALKNEKDYKKAIAGLLMDSVVSAIDEKGMLPASLNYLTSAPIGTRKLLPENFYGWIYDLNYQPKLEKVTKADQESFYVYHRAERLEAKVAPTSVELQFSRWHAAGSHLYPVGVLNNFYVADFSGFSRIGMMSSPSWPGAPDFESWRVGYYYWESDRVLTAMLRHRSEFEAFTIEW